MPYLQLHIVTYVPFVLYVLQLISNSSSVSSSITSSNHIINDYEYSSINPVFGYLSHLFDTTFDLQFQPGFLLVQVVLGGLATPISVTRMLDYH